MDRNQNPELPLEILLDIFTRLPTKSVGRCRTLSKSWKGHLSTSDFVQKHLISRKQTIQQQNLAFITENYKVYITTSPDTKDMMVFRGKTLPGKWFPMLGSCNGLLLLEHFNIYLLNPITGKHVTINRPLLLQRGLYERRSVYGLGFDSGSNDYKIVRLCSFWTSIDNRNETFVDVYSVKSGVWKRVEGCYPFGEDFIPRESSCEGGAFSFVNGAVHWLIYRGGYRSCIAAFDVANEGFREIPLPEEFLRQLDDGLDAFTQRRRWLFVVGGCLSIVDNHGNGTVDIWIMKEYEVAESWVKIHIEDKDGKWHVYIAACAFEDGKLLCQSSWFRLLAFDLKRGTAKDVLVAGYDNCYSHVMPIVESLVSPDGSS